MNKPHLVVSKFIESSPITYRVLRTIVCGAPEDLGNGLVAFPIRSPRLPDGPYLGRIQMGVTHDEIELIADRGHQSMKFGQVAYGPVNLADEPVIMTTTAKE